MLTEAEKNWMRRREGYLKHYCRHCQFFKPYDAPHVIPGYCQGDSWCCPVNGKDIIYSMQDAAEFEARVALELTDYDASYRPSCPDNCRSIRNCRECHLMYARLAVKAEMDNTAGSK